MSLDISQWIRIGLPPDAGFHVHYEEVKGGCLTGRYWPENGTALPTEEIAWAYAEAFANEHTLDRFVNIYVVDRELKPVEGYEGRRVGNRNLKGEHDRTD